MELSQVLGYIATFLFSVMYIPQIIKTVKLQSVTDVSLVMYILGFVANIIALIYALMIHQTPLVVKYIIGIVAVSIYLGVYIKVRGKK